MDSIHLFDNEAITPNLLVLIVRKLSDQSAVRLARTCRAGYQLSSSKRGKALETFEKAVKEYRQLVGKNTWLRSLSLEQTRNLAKELDRKVSGSLQRRGVLRVDLNNVYQRRVVSEAIPLLKIFEMENVVERFFW